MTPFLRCSVLTRFLRLALFPLLEHVTQAAPELIVHIRIAHAIEELPPFFFPIDQPTLQMKILLLQFGTISSPTCLFR